jgi:hypothetical protein
MVKITSKLYTPKNLLEVINAVDKILVLHYTECRKSASDIVIDLRKIGYKIVKVDDGE